MEPTGTKELGSQAEPVETKELDSWVEQGGGIGQLDWIEWATSNTSQSLQLGRNPTPGGQNRPVQIPP